MPFVCTRFQALNEKSWFQCRYQPPYKKLPHPHVNSDIATSFCDLNVVLKGSFAHVKKTLSEHASKRLQWQNLEKLASVAHNTRYISCFRFCVCGHCSKKLY